MKRNWFCGFFTASSVGHCIIYNVHCEKHSLVHFMAPNSMEKKTAPGYGKPPWIFKGRQASKKQCLYCLYSSFLNLYKFFPFVCEKAVLIIIWTVFCYYQCPLSASPCEIRACSSIHPERVQISWSFWVLLFSERIISRSPCMSFHTNKLKFENSADILLEASS